ncbi:uncharacterized protein LOC106637816 [Copidosoma floridanum]|uniref:uncharacterized protein LOC106637816 n=1 Tax=Copidosoma floridanum TaxID=29053 RepID=UPI0006C9DBB3|nr:uncharacterized protein LOC106637816 [Copidosoma floridanum]
MQIDESNEQCVPDLLSRADELADEFMRDMIEEARETERRIEQLQLAVWPSSGKVTSKSKRSSVVNWLFKCQIAEEEEAVAWRGVNKRKNDNDYDDGSETGNLLRMEKRRKTEEKEEVFVAEKSVDAQRKIRTTVEKEVAVFSTNLALQPAAGSPLDLTEMIRRLVQCARSAQYSRMSIDFCLRVDPSIALFRFMQLHQRVMSNVFWHTRFNHWCKDNNPLQQTSSAKITDLSNTDSNKGLLRNEEFPKVSDPKVVISFPAQRSKANRPKQNKSDQEPRGYNYVRNPPLLSARKESYDMQSQKSVESVKKLQFPMLKKDCYKPKVSITLNKYLFDPIEEEVPELEGDFQNQPVNFHNSNLENCLGPGVKKMVKRTPLSDVTSEDLNLGSLCVKPTKLTSINKTKESNSETTPLSSTEITKISLPVSLPIDEISPNMFFYSLPQYSYSDDFNNDFHPNRQVTYGCDGSNAYNYSSDEECPPQNKACSPIVGSENVNEKTINSVSNIKQQNKENSADKQGEESINKSEEISKSDCVLAENRCKKINEQYITTNKSDEVVNENDDSNDDNFDNMVLVLSSTTSDDNSDFEHNKENIVEMMHQDTEESTTNLDSDNIAYVKDKNMNEKKSMADIVQQENVPEPSKLSHCCEPQVDSKAEAKSLKLVIVRNGSTEKWGIKRKTSSETDSLSDKSLTKKSSPPETAVTEHVSEPVLHRDVEMAVNTVNTEDNHVLAKDTQVAPENSSYMDIEMAINTVNTEDNHVLANDNQVTPENSLHKDAETGTTTTTENVSECNRISMDGGQIQLIPSLHKDVEMGTTTTAENVSECSSISTDGDQNQLKPSLHKDAEVDESATDDECNYVIADDSQVVPDNEDHLEGGDFDFVNEITYDSDHDSYMCDNSLLKESEAVMECVTFTNEEKSHEDEDIIFLEAKTSKPMVVNKHIHQMKSEEITLETFNELNLHKSIVAPETAKEESNNDITNEEQEVFKKSLNALMNDVVLRDADSTVDNNNEILTCSKLTSAQLNIFQAYNITVVDDLENFPNKVYGKNNAVHPPIESIPVQPPVQPTIRVRNMNELLAKPNDIPISSDCTAGNNNLTVQATPINVITAPQTNILVPHVPAQASKVIVASQLYANMFDMPGSNEHSTSNVPKNQPMHDYDIFSLPLRPYEYFQLPEPCSIYDEDSEDVKLAKVRKYQKALQKKIREAVQYFQMNKNLVVQSIDSFLHYKTLNMNNVYFHQYLNSYFQCFCAIRRISGYTTTNFIMWVMINTLENSPDGCIFFSKANSFICMSQLCKKMGGHAFISNYENEPFLEDLDNEYMHRNQPNQILMMSQEQKKVFFKQVAMYRKIVGLL